MLGTEVFGRRIYNENKVQHGVSERLTLAKLATRGDFPFYGTPEGRKCINSFSHFHHHVKAAFHGRMRSSFRLWQNHYSVCQLTERICHNMRSSQVVDIKV